VCVRIVVVKGLNFIEKLNSLTKSITRIFLAFTANQIKWFEEKREEVNE